MELIRTTKKTNSFISEIVYILLNAGLATGVLVLVLLFSNSTVPLLAFLLVILSKWRVFAVQPRYWWDNLQSNLLDLVVGLSFVAFIWNASDNFWLQVSIAALYALWLIILKPMTSHQAIIVQAAVGQFFAITSLFSVAFVWPSSWVVVCMLLIGFVAARHTLLAFDEEDTTLLSMIWAVIVAELGWIAHHYTIAYSVISTNLQIPQIAIIITLLWNVAVSALSMHRNKQKITMKRLLGPLLFMLIVSLIMLIFMSKQDFIS